MTKFSSYLKILFEKWINPDQKVLVILLIFIILVSIFSAILVYQTGGTQYSYAHIVYIPLILSALVFKIKGGIVSGLILGLIILGPLMPLNTTTNQMQNFINWSTRMFFLVLVGFVLGVIFQILSSQSNKLRKQAFYDLKTDLPNRFKLENKIQELIFNKRVDCFSVILIDIDNLPEIINNIGHDKTADFLRQVANELKNSLDKDTEIYNLYNDKFAFLNLTGKVSKVIDRLSLKLDKPFYFDGIPIYINTFFGIASYPVSCNTGEDILQRAYTALHKAEKNNKKYEIIDCVIIDHRKNLTLLGSVNKALADDQFVLYYQPKIDVKKEKVVGVEALIRWEHPEEGFIPPNQFIPQIEKTGLINNLTMWVIKRVAKDLLALKKENININAAVNISARNLKTDGFLSDLDKALKEHKIKAEKIELELTETDIMSELKKGRKILSHLANSGFKIALDDFGTGYSSLAYLKNLPIDTIKVDRAFVKDIVSDSRDKEIVKTAIKMSHVLEKNVVAEGVECKTGLEILKQLDCDQAQGYYISKPKPFSEFKNWIFDSDFTF